MSKKIGSMYLNDLDEAELEFTEYTDEDKNEAIFTDIVDGAQEIWARCSDGICGYAIEFDGDPWEFVRSHYE